MSKSMESDKREKSLKRKLRRYQNVFDKLSSRVTELEREVSLLKNRECLRSISEFNRGSYLKLVDFDNEKKRRVSD